MHLLRALLDEEQGVVRPVIQKIGANLGQLESIVDSELSRMPKVSGSQRPSRRSLGDDAGAGESPVDRRWDEGRVRLHRAHPDRARRKSGDQVQRLLDLNGVRKADVLNALKTVRGSQQVIDQNPEDKYQSLENTAATWSNWLGRAKSTRSSAAIPKFAA